MKKIKLSFLALSVLSIGLLSSCGSDSSQTTTEQTTQTGTPAPDATPATVTIEISGTDQMKFDKSDIVVHEGQEVTLILHHSGKLPKATMGHNWVLLNQGVDMQAFDEKAAKAGEKNDYIPQDAASDMIAHTKLLGGGESDTITFKAPAEGAYDFLCSFPGHSSMMKGKFVVMK